MKKKIGFSNDDENEPAVIFPGSDASMRRLAGLYDSTPEETSYSLSELVQQPKIKKLLLKSNIFIYGKVGFFDFVLKTLLPLAGKRDIETIYTENQLVDYRKKIHSANASGVQPGNKSQKIPDPPIILLPMADTPEKLNRFITTALIDKPVWLIAIPSLLNRSLLLSFNCFFLPEAPEKELSILYDMTSLTENDFKKQNLKAIFIADHSIKDLGLRDRIGTVIPIDRLE